MKRMKKLASLLLAAIMVLAMMVPAMATGIIELPEGKYTITIKDTPNHVFNAYQIFVGETASEGDDVILSNITWGTGITEAGKSALFEKYLPNKKDPNVDDPHDIQELAEELEGVSGAELANVLQEYLNPGEDNANVIGFTSSGEGAEVTYKSSEVANGYYIVVDTITEGLKDKDDAYSSYIIKVVGENVEAEPKKSHPSVEKEVKDNDDKMAEGENNDWGETADHEINESFQFRLTAKLAENSNYAFYESYKLVFNDTMDTGITYESIESVQLLKSDGSPINIPAVEGGNNGYTTNNLTANMAGGTWSLTIPDVLKFIKANELAAGIQVVVIYNAHLNENAVVTKPNEKETTYSGEDAANQANKNKVNLEYSNNPNAGGEGELGKTPDDTVFVFTYEIPSTKYGEEDGNQEALDGAEFTLYVGDQVTTSDGERTNAVTLKYNSAKEYYYPAKEGDTDTVKVMTSANGGIFNVAGLDVGEYTLVETKTPAGYNTCDPILVKVVATHKETNKDVSELKVTMTINNGAEPATMNKVINKKGATLPETGGIGTTIFYVLGTILVVGAVILLVTKKRMSVEK